MDVISFADLELSKNCNIKDEIEKHSNQAGSVFPRRSEALKALELAKDNVKYQLGKLEMDTHALGTIPNPIEGEKGIKITGASMTAYLNSHPVVVKARNERAQAEHDYDNVKGLVTAYNARKDLLQTLKADRVQEFYSDVK